MTEYRPLLASEARAAQLLDMKVSEGDLCGKPSRLVLDFHHLAQQ